MVYTVLYCTQSRQSAKISLQSSELGLPHPLTRRRMCPPPFGTGGRGILAGERGGGRVLISTRRHTLWYSIYMCTLWYTYLQTQYVGNTDGVLQYRIPSSSEETVYSTSSGLYPASVQKRLATEPEVMSLLRHLILVILWRAGGGIHFSPIFTLKILEYAYN